MAQLLIAHTAHSENSSSVLSTHVRQFRTTHNSISRGSSGSVDTHTHMHAYTNAHVQTCMHAYTQTI